MDGRICVIPLIIKTLIMKVRKIQDIFIIYLIFSKIRHYIDSCHPTLRHAVEFTIPKDRSGRFSGQKVPNCDNNLSKELEWKQNYPLYESLEIFVSQQKMGMEFISPSMWWWEQEQDGNLSEKWNETERNKRYVLVSNIPALVEHIAKLCSSFQVSVYHIGKL